MSKLCRTCKHFTEARKYCKAFEEKMQKNDMPGSICSEYIKLTKDTKNIKF